jgi:hypothetical protein
LNAFFWQAEDAPVDAAADQLALKFLHDSLPPSLSPAELAIRFRLLRYNYFFMKMMVHVRVADALTTVQLAAGYCWAPAGSQARDHCF